MISDRWRLLAVAKIGTVAALAAADALEAHGVKVVKVDRSETPHRDIHLVEPPAPTVAPHQGERERARRRRQMAKKEG